MILNINNVLYFFPHSYIIIILIFSSLHNHRYLVPYLYYTWYRTGTKECLTNNNDEKAQAKSFVHLFQFFSFYRTRNSNVNLYSKSPGDRKQRRRKKNHPTFTKKEEYYIIHYLFLAWPVDKNDCSVHPWFSKEGHSASHCCSLFIPKKWTKRAP